MELNEVRNIALDLVTALEPTPHKLPEWSHLYKFVNKKYVSYLDLMHEIDQLMENRDSDWEDDDININLMLVRNWLRVNV